ncbi:MAG: hypothetical protein BMS9Abin36_2062 [Gammaproteobacteria bacterium]|nr:MAG: hypothetical protein BMS9Abin36_2062 [Gammaproteobacteria bacterium]
MHGRAQQLKQRVGLILALRDLRRRQDFLVTLQGFACDSVNEFPALQSFSLWGKHAGASKIVVNESRFESFFTIRFSCNLIGGNAADERGAGERGRDHWNDLRGLGGPTTSNRAGAQAAVFPR